MSQERIPRGGKGFVFGINQIITLVIIIIMIVAVILLLSGITDELENFESAGYTCELLEAISPSIADWVGTCEVKCFTVIEPEEVEGMSCNDLCEKEKGEDWHCTGEIDCYEGEPAKRTTEDETIAENCDSEEGMPEICACVPKD